jgi:hypothetical protein
VTTAICEEVKGLNPDSSLNGKEFDGSERYCPAGQPFLVERRSRESLPKPRPAQRKPASDEKRAQELRFTCLQYRTCPSSCLSI